MEKQWYLSRGDHRLGPFPLSKIKQLIATGKVTREDRLCQKGTLEWHKAEAIEGLFAAAKREPPSQTTAATEVRTPPFEAPMPDKFATMRPPPALAINASPRLVEYLFWRRALCIILLPISLTAMALSIFVFTKDSPTHWNQFGKLVQAASLLSVAGIPLAAAVGASYFQRFREPALAMLGGWGLAFAAPAIFAFIPLTWEVSVDDAMTANRASALSGISFIGGLSVLGQLIPILFALPIGALRGAARNRLLLPESGLSGWIILASSLALVVLFSISLVVCNQIAPNPLPTVGFGLLLAAATWLLVDWRVILKPVAIGAGLPFQHSFLRFRWLFWAGVGALVLFLLSYEYQGVRLIGIDEKESAIRPWNATLWKFVAEFVARSLATMIFSADLSLQVSILAWRMDQEIVQTGGDDARNRAFTELSSAL